MRKRTETTHKPTRRITMPDVVDLSTYNWLDVAFTNGKKGTEVLIFSFAARLTAQSNWQSMSLAQMET